MRPMLDFLIAFATFTIWGEVHALSMDDLSKKDAVGGLKEALTQGAVRP